MATLSFSFDTGNVSIARIIDGMTYTYGYQSTIPDPQTGQPIPSPQSKAEFGKAQIRRIITEAVKNAEAEIAKAAAEAAVQPITLN